MKAPRTATSLLEQVDDPGDHCSLQLDDSWLQGRSWYGGVQLALALHAIRKQVDAAIPLRSLHAAFIAPVGHEKPARATAEILRAGRSVTQARGRLEQDGKPCFDVMAIFGRERESTIRVDSNQPADMDAEDALRLEFRPGITPNCTQHYDMRWVSGSPPFTSAPNARATILARPRADFEYNETEFLALTDVIPPPVISLMRQPTPVSSMNFALELIRPESLYGSSQWLRFESELHDSHSGYGWQTARMYSESGELVAIGHQSVAVFG